MSSSAWSRAARVTRRCRCGCSSPVRSVAKSVSRSHRKKPADMVTIIEDLYGLLEGVEGSYRAGRHPDAKIAKPTAKVLRALADELEL